MVLAVVLPNIAEEKSEEKLETNLIWMATRTMRMERRNRGRLIVNYVVHSQREETVCVV